jgi:hypothetical protein
MTRLVRRITAIAAIAALAFAQLAVSAYACALETPSRAAAVTENGSVGCDEIANANLCEKHCDYGASSVGLAALSIPALPATPLPWRLETVAPASFAAGALDRQFLDSHPPPSPILFGVLRI